MDLTVDVAGKSDVGCVRSNNEDNFGYDSRYGIYVVCDGMGGQAAGEVAAKIAVDTILGYFRDANHSGELPQTTEEEDGSSERSSRLSSAIQLANKAVVEEASKHASQSGMGSTVVAVLTEGNLFSIAHIGDSRIYLVRNGEISQLTNDHSLVMEQVRRGLITMDEARTSKMQNIIIKALGTEEGVQPDVDDLFAQEGDVVLLCSDGLTRHLTDQNIAEIVSTDSSVQTICDRLIQSAKDKGGEDNVTCLLLRFVEKAWYKKLLGVGGGSKWQNSL
jgi:serine/threonine protein phosphatase PrpC